MVLLCLRGSLANLSSADYEALKPRLQALLKAQEEDAARASSLERRVANLMERHATNVSCLSLDHLPPFHDNLSSPLHVLELISLAGRRPVGTFRHMG